MLMVQTAVLNLLTISRLFIVGCGLMQTLLRLRVMAMTRSKYMMVAVEHFSKYSLLVPLTDQHAMQTPFVLQDNGATCTQVIWGMCRSRNWPG